MSLAEIRKWHAEHPQATSWTWAAIDRLIRVVDDQSSLLNGSRVYALSLERQRDVLLSIVRNLVAADGPSAEAFARAAAFLATTPAATDTGDEKP